MIHFHKYKPWKPKYSMAQYARAMATVPEYIPLPTKECIKCGKQK